MIPDDHGTVACASPDRSTTGMLGSQAIILASLGLEIEMIQHAIIPQTHIP